MEAVDARMGSAAHQFLQEPARPFIAGRFVESASNEAMAVHDPATGSLIAEVPDCNATDIDRAVRAARAALEGPWGKMRPAERETVILTLAAKVEEHADTLAELETLNTGKSLGLSRNLDIGFSIEYLRYMAGWSTKISGQTLSNSLDQPPGSAYFTYTLREPVGVVGAIVPWNFPLLIAIWKIAPALAAGCTVVLKPSEETPLTALYFARLLAEAGIPEGVVNIIPGRGSTAGAALTAHSGIAKLTFTGSTTVGKAIGHAAVDRMARFTLELGGKSPMVVFDDVEDGAEPLMANIGMFMNQGQVCTAATRLFIHRSIYDRTLQRIADALAPLRYGSGFDPEAQINPMVSKRHQQRVQGFIDRAGQAGAKHHSAHASLPADGFYVAPHLLYDVDPGMEVYRDEVFGPVIAALPFDDEDEAVRLANDTAYGLGASVWTRDIERTMRMTQRIKAGTVWVNMHNMLDPNLPFGGYKQSGMGREHGKEAVLACLESKTVMIRHANTSR